ncbi:winged helix-turn-helix domain-containing protein [Ornithinimicrobium avium]|uniref:Winged helix family transcriptional regulator n=1 Tax=Ornithinimicrobium avium TaxID=2283195 RepID=A0A345NJ39_9MICO|nr:winged helix-turn-helix domain-containing protein [Ornithinimicrobium avium]AXH95047.1 winged helix family transcriptional regulator [Ornithinimicrobium avium]
MAVQVSDDMGAGEEGEVLSGVGGAVSLIPAVGAASGALVVLMSACSVEGLRTLATAWAGPVLVVGSVEEARAVLGTAAPADRTTEPATGPGPTLLLDEDRRVVGDGRSEVPLTPLEFDFLVALSSDPGRLRTFEELQHEVWGTPHIGDVTQVHSLVKRLRRKLRRLDLPVRLQAVRGIGFRLVRPARLTPVRR